MVETGGLENRLALTGYGGSNPSPSAITSFERASMPLIVLESAEFARGNASFNHSAGSGESDRIAFASVLKKISPTVKIGEYGSFYVCPEKFAGRVLNRHKALSDTFRRIRTKLPLGQPSLVRQYYYSWRKSGRSKEVAFRGWLCQNTNLQNGSVLVGLITACFGQCHPSQRP